MIILTLGIIIGLLFSILAVLVGSKLPQDARKIPELIQTTFKRKPTGAIIEAPSDEMYSLQKKFESATEDTRLDDLIS